MSAYIAGTGPSTECISIEQNTQNPLPLCCLYSRSREIKKKCLEIRICKLPWRKVRQGMGVENVWEGIIDEVNLPYSKLLKNSRLGKDYCVHFMSKQ